MDFSEYQTEGFYDELFAADGQPHDFARPLMEQIAGLSARDLQRRQKAAESLLHQSGATFAVYGSKQGSEKVLPFDIIPRLIPATEWRQVEAGLKQRQEALNRFIADIYGPQKILKDKVIPKALVHSSGCYLQACEGLQPSRGIWVHIAGTDLVRDGSGAFQVLEDNLRCPSGISYVLENRAVQKRTFPHAFSALQVQPVSNYPDHLYETLRQVAPHGVSQPTIVVLTPGAYNSAYFEHAFLARQMGVTLAEGSDLVVQDGYVMLRTTRGLQKVDVIYRRIDDDFLDPEAFRKDSVLGVPGLMECYRNGRVTLANAPGTGIADDKAVYAYVPAIIKYYLDEDAIIPNVPTYLCSDAKQRDHVLANLDTLVVKATNLSGGYGMLIGPKASSAEREAFAERIKARPREYIAQPTLALSRSPTLVKNHLEGRHVDLRPYILSGASTYVLPGGLTRVALVKDSLVVNSSQGGGSKDSWVLSDTPREDVSYA